jgi:hypothetical protein
MFASAPQDNAYRVYPFRDAAACPHGCADMNADA